MELSVPFYRQENEHFCAPAVLQMLFAHHGTHFSQAELARRLGTTPEKGTRNDRMVGVLREEKFYCYENNESTALEIRHYVLLCLPVVVNFIEHSEKEGHYALIVGFDTDNFIMHDPLHGERYIVAEKDFVSRWHDDPNLRHHPDYSVYERWMLVADKTTALFGTIYPPKNSAASTKIRRSFL